MTIQIPEQKGYSINSTPQQYRLKKNLGPIGAFEYTLQGMFEYKDKNGAGYEWRDIETVEETK